MKIDDSSNITDVEYDNGILTVTFTNNTVYQYMDVPEQTYYGLINAVSKGQYLATHIKGHYAYRHV